jgi:hypothetical protein
LLVAVPVVVSLVLMPGNWWARYTFFLPLAVLPFAAVALSRLRGRAALAASVVLVAGGGWSLAVATAHGNLVTGRDGQARASLPDLARLVGASDAERRTLGLWGACARLADIPAGSAVATDNFIFQHLVVGHAGERLLAPKVSITADPARLRAEVDRLGARWLVLDRDRAPMTAVLADPVAFRLVGPVCRNADLVEVLPR